MVLVARRKKVDKKSKIFNLLLIFTLLITLPVATYLAINRTSFFNKAFGTPANLVVDMGSSYKSQGQSWRNLAQGGEEKTQMLSSVTDKLSVLAPKYIRVDHIYDFYDVVERDGGGNITYNWSGLDKLVNDIRSTGATPYLNISYMPAALSSGGTTDYPKNWGEWQALVRATVARYSGQLGISEIYYEVWNEPDLLGNFKTYGDKSYLTLYENTAKAASGVQNTKPYKIGGPATTSYYSAWTKDLLKFVKENNLRLDFLSWHEYSYSLSDFENNWTAVSNDIADSGYGNPVELILSEYGYKPEKDHGYDTDFSSIHTIAVAATLESRVSKLFTFEIKDGVGDSKYSGSWGILTNDKFGPVEEKPRFFALKFLNQMTGEKVNVAGSGSWVKSFAKRDGDTTRILVVNYDPQGKHYEAVPIKLVNLKSGSVKVKRINYKGATSEKNYTVETDTLELNEGFDPNSASIFEVKAI